MEEQTFSFPSEWKIETDNEEGQGICVVGIFGKHRLSSASKAYSINEVVNKHIFGSYESENIDDTETNEKFESVSIEGYFDSEKHVLYLHLIAVYDSVILNQLCKKLENLTDVQDMHVFWKDHEIIYAKALLYLFSVCHLILVMQPHSRFDVSYIRLFRALDATRSKLQPIISEELKKLAISKEWQNSGRMCTPRLLFVGQQHILIRSSLMEDVGSHDQGKGKFKAKKSPLKRLQHSTEDQIYRIFRKTKIITNQSSSNLFSLPANQAFVYIYSEPQPTDLIGLILEHFSAKVTKYRQSKGILDVPGDAVPKTGSEKQMIERKTLSQFLWQHIDLVLSKSDAGFEDSQGRVPAHFEVPSVGMWTTVAVKLHQLLLGDLLSTKTEKPLKGLKTMLDLDTAFSESRCAKVLPLATRTYQENLPDHYTSRLHQAKLAQAMNAFSQNARGPACGKYIGLLKEDCQRYWHNGRQLCEQLSLTGQHCLHPLHRVTEEDADVSDQTLPIMPHASQAKMTSACNCGRKQGQREDPFDTRAANSDFYQKLASKCCTALECHQFPLFEPDPVLQSSDSAVGSLLETQMSDGDGNGPEVVETEGEPTAHTDDTSSSMAKKEDDESAEAIAISGNEILKDFPIISIEDEVKDEVKEKDSTENALSGKAEGVLVKQASTVDYLEEMVHSQNLAGGLLPLFSSWSLVCLGKSSFYKPSAGLDQPGFLQGTNYLLPWDVHVTAKPAKPAPEPETASWPAPSETGWASFRKGAAGRYNKDKRSQKDEGEHYVAHLYVGNEYECFRGHRVICSGPERVVKATGNGIFRDTAHKLVTADMPLYFPCPSRASKPHLTQLMRVHIVTPNTASLTFQLNPRVQPGYSSPVFYPAANGTPVTIPSNSYWVLRLPYIYVTNNGPVRPPPPSEPQGFSTYRILKGLYSAFPEPSKK